MLYLFSVLHTFIQHSPQLSNYSVLCEWPVRYNGRTLATQKVLAGRLTSGSCSHACAPVTKYYTLVLTDGRWRSSAGKVTAGLAKSNGSLLRVYGFKSHLQADCLYTGISSGPNTPKIVWENTISHSFRLAKHKGSWCVIIIITHIGECTAGLLQSSQVDTLLHRCY